MVYQLNFAQLLSYDVGEPGITAAVTLELNGLRTSFNAKIDTGTDHCIFERQQGEHLGLTLEPGLPQRFRTATGSFLAYGHDVTLHVADLRFDSLVFFASETTFARNVLGRFGWLDRVALGLIDYEGKLYLSRYRTE